MYQPTFDAAKLISARESIKEAVIKLHNATLEVEPALEDLGDILGPDISGVTARLMAQLVRSTHDIVQVHEGLAFIDDLEPVKYVKKGTAAKAAALN